MNAHKKLIRLLLLGLVLAGSNLACNTVKGAGEDIQEGGQAIENAAEDAQN